ncbi:hypothetical protein [Pseudonocardia sichuanensis]
MRVVIWLAGLLVAVGAAVATAHGLYEVAVAARVPAGIAWLYPLITDGLALVAYAASARLTGSAARYAWSVVVLAAGLSGLAQAMFLASDTSPPPVGVPRAHTVAGVEAVGPVFEASAALRFGVGAWPAIAAAIVAHLLYLLATDHPATGHVESGADTSGVPEPPVAGGVDPAADVQPALFKADRVQLAAPGVQSVGARAVQPGSAGAVQRSAAVAGPSSRPALAPNQAEQPDRRTAVSPARDRARAAASRHAHHHGHLPTVSELEAAAQVSRGTAATVLKHLREQPTPLHLITTTTQEGTPEDDPTIEEHAHP